MFCTVEIPIDKFTEIEPQLKGFYGIDRNSLFDIIRQSVDMNKLNEVGEPYSENNRTNDFMECAFKVLDSIYIEYDDEQFADFVALCKKYEIEATSIQYQVLLFLYFLSAQKEREYLTDFECFENEFWQYATGVRPEMLKLYIALHNGKTEYRNSVRIAFGDCSPIKVDTMFPWLQMALDKYLNKYLGVKDLKEAEHEFNTVYKNQKVGVKLNVTEVTYMWGTYHLLQTIEKLKSSRPKSVTNKQSNFITEYLSLLNILDNKYTEARTLRVRLRYFLKTYDTLDELKQDTHYKTSPNNKGGMRYF